MAVFFVQPIKRAGNRADILGLGFPPLRFLHYLLTALRFLFREEDFESIAELEFG